MNKHRRQVMLIAALSAVALTLIGSATVLMAHLGSLFHSDPPAVVTFSSPTLTILRQELDAWRNYGVADGAVDILYSAERNQWEFDLSAVSLPGPVQSAEVRISLVLDDHYIQPESDYRGRILLNGVEVFSGASFSDLGVSHGTPFDAIFDNWKVVVFSVPNVTPTIYTVLIENNYDGAFPTSWIAIDYIELHLHTLSNQPPDCGNAVASPSELWPPNHKMKAIGVTGVTDPDEDTVTVEINSIFQDEPVKGGGSGNTGPDGSGVGSDTAEVRAERSGKSDGRVYEINFTASDGNGGTCSATVEVGVPHDQRGDPAINSGATYDSTAG